MINNVSTINNYDIKKYGIIYTPKNLVDKILDLIPIIHFKNPNYKWLDIGAGTGAFSDNLFNRLDIGLTSIIYNRDDRKNHIIKNMIYMAEVHPEHIKELENKFTKDANIIRDNFLSITNKNKNIPLFNFIIGNPPYNINGSIKTPTNTKQDKREDGKTIYVDFINKSLDLLKDHGFLNLIIPSLWLKPDKAGLYKTLTSLKIHKLHNLSTSETFKLFEYKAQLPTSFFFIEKTGINLTTRNNCKIIPIYDKHKDSYIDYNLPTNFPIPIHGVFIINKLLKYVNDPLIQSLKYYKTNTPSKNSKFCDTWSKDNPYINIKTCLLSSSNSSPEFIINYSNKYQHYYDIPKLVLAHKMYGFPYFDISGKYGISTRDNYVILNSDYSIDQLKQIQYFLSTKFAIFIFSATNYRMRYLERYAFQLIPNIINIPDFPDLINLSREIRDKKIYDFFSLSKDEIEIIENYTKTDYIFFV